MQDIQSPFILQELYFSTAAYTTKLREKEHWKINLHLLERIKVDLHELIGISCGFFHKLSAYIFVQRISATLVVGKSITRLSENMRIEQQ